MKNLIYFLGTLILGFMFLTYLDPMYPQKVQRVLYYSPCETNLTYKIGSIDPKFGMSKEKLLEDTKKATNVWNNHLGKDLISYDENSTLTVSMVFDDRQSLTKQITALESDLNSREANFSSQVEKHDAEVLEFKQKSQELNSEIQEWNQKGGAPEDVYNSLIDRQKALQQEAQRLNAQAKKLNLSAKDFNKDVEGLNDTVSSFNKAIKERPEGGIFDPNEDKIEIYVYLTEDELIHTLTHEFGHALGLEHTDEKDSIMYPYATKSTKLTQSDFDELDRACNVKGFIPLLKQRILEVTN